MLIGHTFPHGLRVEVGLEIRGTDKPIVFTFTYSLDQTAMTQWLRENTLLTEGPLSFVFKGIDVVIPGADKVDKAGFSITDEDTEQIWLPLIERPVVFKVHRNLFGGQEWECFYADAESDEADDDAPF